MFTSFSTALSALNATATAVDVVGNNLANLNTTGYKTSVVSFHDLVTQSLGAGLGETQVGFGTARPSTVRQFTQGAVQASSGLLDAAIQGDGFFIVRDPSSGAVLYRRAGDFQVDANGLLLTGTKEKVQGWTEANGTVDTNGPIGDIRVPVGSLRQPSATTEFSMDLNLNAAGSVGQSDGSFSSSIEVVDSLGMNHVLTINFTKTGQGAWDYEITTPAADVAGATTDPVSLAKGSLTFDSGGALTSPDAKSGPVVIPAIKLADGAADLNIQWQLRDASGTPHLTQFAQPSAVSAQSADGTAAAQLTRVGLSDGGQILAQYSNGTQQVVAQVALASIRNPESLIAVGNNNFQASAQTAMPAVGVSGTGGRGQILGGSLEASTVDIAREFTDLIVLQRGYEANAKVVSAVDELSQDTINLKR